MCFQYRSWAKYLGGGQPGRAKPMGVRGKKPCKLLKFSFLKSLQMHPILKLAHIYGDLIYYYFFLSISRKLLGGGGPPGPSPSYGTGFISFSVLLRANSCRVSQWTADTVDQILTDM